MREVHAQIDIAADPYAALAAFMDIDAMREWWGVEGGLIESRPGGVWAVVQKLACPFLTRPFPHVAESI